MCECTCFNGTKFECSVHCQRPVRVVAGGIVGVVASCVVFNVALYTHFLVFVGGPSKRRQQHVASNAGHAITAFLPRTALLLFEFVVDYVSPS